MIGEYNKVFVLETDATSYLFQVTETGHLEHLYYGGSLCLGEAGGAGWEGGIRALSQKATNATGVVYDAGHPAQVMNILRQEVSGRGCGDYLEPFAELVFADGSSTVDFLYEKHEIVPGAPVLRTLPSALAGQDEACTLILTLHERHRPVTLEVRYTVLPACDCILRSALLHNGGEEPVTVEKLMSLQLDVPGSGYELISFHGEWAKEMQLRRTPVNGPVAANASVTGFSSNQANPFVMLAAGGAGEEQGQVYACNLIYSGNHLESAQLGAFDKTRLLAGINPDFFSWRLEPGESFEAPQAVLTCSDSGFGEISRRMHRFVRRHIVRGQWQYRERPVLLNSWEAAYFHFDESKLLRLARAGRDAGIELFVMDDGWFGRRNDDTSSLGDWTVNAKKLPGGIRGIAEKIEALGMKFGIWVEPEMVNEDSELYRAHPDWAVRIPGRHHSTGRNQMLLDLTRPEVRENLLQQMTAVFSAGPISYVKWDMNRNFSDMYSASLPAGRQKEFCHRYIMGLYQLLDALVARFPHILFESCASGGNRFDLGMLCYMPQIWSSDNTDAICRTYMQNGYSYGYPQSVMGAHVSGCPNHQTLRETPLASRFAVACMGVLGYECNLAELPKEELAEIKEQIRLYKQWRRTLQFGDFYRSGGSLNPQLRGAVGSNLAEWTVVSPDQKQAVGMMIQETVKPNTSHNIFRPRGLAADKLYRFTNRVLAHDLHRFGDLINAVAPIHIKKDSLLHNTIAKFMKMDGEVEDTTLPGSVLCRAGVELAQSFAGTGYNANTRLYQDFDARLYFMAEVTE